jgi:hypothetical protein
LEACACHASSCRDQATFVFSISEIGDNVLLIKFDKISWRACYDLTMSAHSMNNQVKGIAFLRYATASFATTIQLPCIAVATRLVATVILERSPKRQHFRYPIEYLPIWLQTTHKEDIS